jgi:hypothetical protein
MDDQSEHFESGDTLPYTARSMRPIVAALVFCALPAFADPPGPPRLRAFPVIEPETNSGFLSSVISDGKVFTLVGMGARKIRMIKICGIALMVEDQAAREKFGKVVEKAGGADPKHLAVDGLAQTFLLQGGFSLIAQLHYVRGMGAKDLQTSFRDALKAEIPKPSAATKKDLEKLVQLLGRDMAEQDDIIIRTEPNGAISVEYDHKRTPGPTNKELVRALWSSWLGPKAQSPELRQALVSRLSALSDRVGGAPPQ